MLREDENGPREETIGKKVSPETVLAEVEKDVIFYDDSGGGVTFSGGEPLCQADFLSALLSECREREIHTAVDTTGYADPRTFARIAEKTDLFLFDLKLMDAEEHRRYTGVSNRRILENLRIAAESRPEVMVRFPVIPKINDSEENIHATARFVRSLGGDIPLAVLPLHRTADAKYERLGMPNRMSGIAPPAEDRTEAVKRAFESFGLNVTVGG